MGKVIVPARIENFVDVFALAQGELPQRKVRAIEVTDALIDTGATTLAVPGHLLAGLGLAFLRTRRARTGGGVREMRMFGPVKLIVQGRDCIGEVLELPDECPVLIGQIPLEAMDFVVDPGRQRLIGNPEHGGEHILEVY